MSATINSSFKIKGLVTFLCRYRSDSPAGAVAPQRYLRNTFFSSHTYKHGYYINSGLRFMSENPARQVDDHTKPAGLDVVKDEEKKVQASSQKCGFFTWGKWLLSSAVAIWLSFLQKGLRLQVLGGKVEEVAEEIEEVAEVVDKVATETEKVFADVVEKLPDNKYSKLKEAALIVENVSTIAASDAQFTVQFVHKAEELKQDFQDLETMAKPLVDEIRKLGIETHK